MTYVAPYELTKLDIAAIKQATYLVIANDRTKGEGPLVQAVKEYEKTEATPFPQSVYHTMPVPVSVQYQYKMPEAKYACVTSTHFYELDHASSVLATLRTGDAIAFLFYPDAHTNGYLEDAGLHGDILYLNVFRKGKQCARFELAHSNCRDNSARMCRLVSTGQLAIG